MTTMIDHRKRAVRAEVRARRRALAATRDRDADGRAIAVHGMALARQLDLRPGDLVAIYEALATEPPTSDFIQALLAARMRVVVPITEPDLDLDWADADDADRHALGRAVIAHCRLMVVPALCVDTTGARLGQGGGSYDRALPRLAPETPIVALLHPEERTAEALPVQPHDRHVDGILTAGGMTWVRSPA